MRLVKYISYEMHYEQNYCSVQSKRAHVTGMMVEVLQYTIHQENKLLNTGINIKYSAYKE